MELKNKVLKQEVVYNASHFEVIRSDVEFPNGDKGKRIFVKPKKAIAVVPYEYNSDGLCYVYLVEQFRDACNQVLLEIPAGKMDTDEEPEDTVIRELMEEIGKKPNFTMEVCNPFLSPGYSSESIHIFLATDLQNEVLERDSHEFLNVVRCPLDEAIQMINEGIIKDGKSIIGLMMLEKALNENKKIS